MRDADSIEIIDLGLTNYRDVRSLQLDAQADVRGGGRECLYLTEHNHVYTLGKHGHAENMLMLPSGVECIRIERGGDITYHGPGQLVVYPIVDLLRRRLGVKAYVNVLEEAVIRMLSDYDVEGGRVEGATGVWLGIGTPSERKICAIGVKISRGVTMHGLAVNINTDLEWFRAINPCGFVDKGVTSLAKEIGCEIDMAEVKYRLSSHLLALL